LTLARQALPPGQVPDGVGEVYPLVYEFIRKGGKLPT
jgi:hypothetical protein